MEVLLIPGRLLDRTLDTRALVETMERGFREQAMGLVEVPRRVALNSESGVTLVMPARGGGVISIKYISIYPGNGKLGMPTAFSLVLLVDEATGMPLALVDGAALTVYRTGAASAVAAKYLSRKGSRSVGFIGAGRQARAHALALSGVMRLEEAAIYDVSEKPAADFSRWLSGLGLSASVYSDVDEVVGRSDVIVAATTSMEPVVRGSAVREGALVISIGWVGPDSREVDEELVTRSSLVIVDSTSALEEAGDLRAPISAGILDPGKVHELSEVIAGLAPGRTDDTEVVLYKGVGSALEDLFAAELAYSISKGAAGAQLFEL